MTKFTTLEEIEAKYAEHENDTEKEKKQKQINKRQARKRFLDRQAREESVKAGPSRITENILTVEQKKIQKEQQRISRHKKYIAKKERLVSQFLKIGHCNINDYTENRVENSRHKLERM